VARQVSLVPGPVTGLCVGTKNQYCVPGFSMKLREMVDVPPWEWPESAHETLLTAVRDRKALHGDRLVAAELAGDMAVIDDELAEALLAVTEAADENVDLRCQAAISLGPALEAADIDGFDDPDDLVIGEETFRRIQETLQRLHEDAEVPKEVRRHTLEASVRAPQEWHREAVRRAYDSGDTEWRRTAVFCMRAFPGFDDRILEALESEDVGTEIQAVLAAAAFELQKAWPHIEALIGSEQTDKELLLAAIEAVAALRPAEAGEVLADLATSDDEDIVEAVQEAMGLPIFDGETLH